MLRTRKTNDEIDQMIKESLDDARYWKKQARIYQNALREIAAGDGIYGMQASEYKQIARRALREGNEQND